MPMINVYRYWVYVMSNKTRSVLYIGVTNDLYRRYCEHKTGVISGFAEKYKCHSLVYYEEFNMVDDAIAREKELKGWRRDKKDRLMTMVNPQLEDLEEKLGWT